MKNKNTIEAEAMKHIYKKCRETEACPVVALVQALITKDTFHRQKKTHTGLPVGKMNKPLTQIQK